MCRRTILGALVAGLSALSAGESVVFGQEGAPAPRPFRRIFGTQEPVAPGRSRLGIDLTGANVFDDNVLAGRLLSADPRVGEGGTYQTAGDAWSFERRGQRVTVLASGSNNIQYYPSLDRRTDHNHAGNLSLDVNVSRATTARFIQSAAYSTYYTLFGIPGAVQPAGGVDVVSPPPVPGQSNAVGAEAGTEIHSFAALERQIGRADSIDFHYGYGLTRFPRRNARLNDVGATYRHGVGRSFGVRAGYGLQVADFGGTANSVLLHNLDGGIDYTKPLPRLRNTTVNLSTGSTVLQLDRGTQYGLRVNGSLVHLFARSWQATIAYNRGAQYVPVIGDVLQSDALTATVGGFASQRAELTFSGAYAKGQLGLNTAAETLTYSGIANAQIGLSRRVAVDVNYQYYLYDFAEAATLPAGLPFGESRQSLRIGLLVRLPLYD
jgi:hypothetical protein